MNGEMNSGIADAVASASFLLTAVALLITALALGAGAWANYRTKQLEAETFRAELAYRFLLAASGGGDARLPDAKSHYSSMEVQTMAISALQAFPEFHETYERMLAERRRVYGDDNTNKFSTRLLEETEALVALTAKSKRRRWRLAR